MFDRSEPLLKLICLGLAALLIYQSSKLFVRRDPLAQVSIPAVPSLNDGSTDGSETNSPGKGAKFTATRTNSAAAEGAPKNGTKGTNAADGAAIKAPAASQTNAVAAPDSKKDKAAPVAAEMPDGKGAATNAAAGLALVAATTNSSGTSIPGSKETNAPVATDAGKAGTNSPGKKVPAKSGTNGVAVMASAKTGVSGTGAAGRKGPAVPRGGRGSAGSGQPTDLPPELKARVEKIYQSELFGPVQHPMPPQLFGIAGKEAFLRASSGQQGAVKEGGEMGGLKLLKVGVNRVLIEENGKQNELMIFSGFGSETLAGKQKDKP